MRGSFFSYWTRCVFTAAITYLKKHYQEQNRRRDYIRGEVEKMMCGEYGDVIQSQYLKQILETIENWNAKPKEEEWWKKNGNKLKDSVIIIYQVGGVYWVVEPQNKKCSNNIQMRKGISMLFYVGMMVSSGVGASIDWWPMRLYPTPVENHRWITSMKSRLITEQRTWTGWQTKRITTMEARKIEAQKL